MSLMKGYGSDYAANCGVFLHKILPTNTTDIMICYKIQFLSHIEKYFSYEFCTLHLCNLVYYNNLHQSPDEHY